MKIALLGYGKMGQLIEQTAQAKGHRDGKISIKQMLPLTSVKQLVFFLI
jgi:prephenate dehydrogenase